MGVPLVGGLPLGRVHPLLSCLGLGRLVAYSPARGRFQGGSRRTRNARTGRGSSSGPWWRRGKRCSRPGCMANRVLGFRGSFEPKVAGRMRFKIFFGLLPLRERNRAPERGTRNGSRVRTRRRASASCDRVVCDRFRVPSAPVARTRSGSRAIEWRCMPRGREKQRSHAGARTTLRATGHMRRCALSGSGVCDRPRRCGGAGPGSRPLAPHARPLSAPRAAARRGSVRTRYADRIAPERPSLSASRASAPQGAERTLPLAPFERALSETARRR
jgi:hypothetical protein